MASGETFPEDIAFEKLEKAIRETPRGDWFLAEYARRNRNADTDAILSRLDDLQPAVQANAVDNQLDYLRNELQQMASSILQARREISAIRPQEGKENRIMAATEELDAIVTSTERATAEILAAAERVQEVSEKLRENGASEDLCNDLDNQSMEIFTACSFQDLTGQRTTKVVNVLRYLEARINAMVSIWGASEEIEPTPDEPGLGDGRPDAHLLNGPQNESVAISQDDIDALMDSDFDSVDVAETAETTSETQAPETSEDGGDFAASDTDETANVAVADETDEEVSQDDIDALFDEPSAA